MDIDYEALAERYKKPQHKGKIRGSFSGSASNSPCGDSITIYVSVGNGGIIEDARHDGHGCALATVSADMLCDYIIGKKINNVCKSDFNTMIRLLGFTPSIGRVGCVKVSLDAFRIACSKVIHNKTNKR
ncbi:MAG: iron-sulfur cluster assembly scaffold protein [Candidatus Micrarchaeia archaeon]